MRKQPLWLLFFLMLLLTMTAGARAQSVWTDKAAYNVGDPVLIYGDGWHGAEAVTLEIIALDGQYAGWPQQQWSVQSDTNGVFQSSTTVPSDALGRTFLLTATCPDGGYAEWVFADGTPTRIQTSSMSPSSGDCGTAISASATLQHKSGGDWVALSGKTVTFTLGSSSGSATTDASGAATASLTVPAGASSLVALFAGDSIDNATSSSITFTVTGTCTVDTTTAVAAQPNPAQCGTAVTLSAQVTASSGTPTGTVQFKLDGANIGAPVPLTAGSATSQPVSGLAVANHTIGASYVHTPSTNFVDSTGSGAFSVVDTTKPVITLTGNATVTVECHAGYTDAGATASDTCSGDLTSKIVTVNSVDANTPGTYTVTYDVSDNAGNAAVQVTRTVTVVDTTPPVITVTGDNPQTVECHTAYQELGATASDACAGDLTSKIIIDASAVSVNAPGTYTVTYDVSDNAGNAAVQVKRTVKVIDSIPPEITLNGASEMTVECHTAYVESGATVTDTCAGDLSSQVKVTGTVDPNTPGTYTLKYNVSDLAGNPAAEVTRTISVVDTTPPVPDLQSLADVVAQCSADLPTAPTATDACAGTIIGVPDVKGPFGQGDTLVTWKFADSYGNSSMQQQWVRVHDTTAPTITAPADVTVSTDAGRCSATNVSLGTPVAADNCGVAEVSNNAPNVFAKGQTIITWTVKDSVGLTATATQKVTVNDTEDPTITAPPTVLVNTGPGVCTASNVALGTPDAKDNCGIASVTNDAPAAFQKGDTTVTWTVTDTSGRAATATQTVTVTDAEKPTIAPPADVAVNTDPGSCTASSVALGTPTTSDNCSVASTASDAPAKFPLGKTSVTWTVTDGSGNTAQATQTVTVTDAEKPVLVSAPADVYVDNDLGRCSASNVVLGSPTVTDNCAGQITVSNDAPSEFPVGTTTVTWSATDANGNTATGICQQKVTVVDAEDPVVTLSKPDVGAVYAVNQTITLAGNAHDNCQLDKGATTWMFFKEGVGYDGPTAVVADTGAISGSGSLNEPGVYSVQLQVRDMADNYATATTIGALPAFVVIYDPNGGFVTGGGWINSPAGAFYSDLTLTGKATFGFVSKYQKGATVPTGNTEFQFKAGNLNFHSTSYDWLVVSGCKAQFKGTGTINGGGTYGFILTAIDGQISGGGGVDKFRIKISDKVTGYPVYDNQLGADDGADPTTTLGGGSIVIHK